MSLQSKYKHLKDPNCNQNYLNFIKKNQLLIHDELQGLSIPKSPQNNQKNSSQSFNVHDNHLEQTHFGEANQGNHSFHSSLSKFQLDSSHINQVSKIYGMGINIKRERLSSFQPGSEEQTIALVQMRTRHAKHEAARELILSSHKNKSIQSKRSDIRESIDRYRPNLEVHSETNTLFPSIQKKTINNFASQTMKDEASLETFREEIRDRMNNLLHKSTQKKQKSQTQKKKSKGQITISSRFRMRQELYGLLPVFRTPVITLDGHKTKNPSYQRKSNKKITNEALLTTPKDTIEHYLQHNVTSKMLLIQKSKEIITMSNKEIRQSPIQQQIIEKKEDILPEQSNQTSQNLKAKPIDMIQKEAIDAKNKSKKPTSLTEVRYEGQLTVYELKIRSYRQFLFMVNLAHRIFDPIHLKESNSFKPEHRYKYYLGKGNNYLLVKSLLKRRFWWTVEQDPKKANFVWTQLKLNYFYQFERKSYIQSKHYKLDKDFEFEQSPKKKKMKANQQQGPPKAGVFKAPLPLGDKKIFTNSDKHYYDEFLDKVDNPQKMLKFSNRLKHFQQKFLKPRACQNIKDERVHNHLEYNYFIGNKKALFYNLKQYYDIQKKNVFDIIPLTYHIKNGTADPQYDIFTKQFKRLAKEKATAKNASKNIWIVKPGQLSNRGQGITVIDEIYELNNILKKKEKHFNGSQKTYIVQKYIQKPLLYKNRKFDIRHYMMISRLHGVMRAYWFGEGYIRTSSYEFNIGEISESIIHLTNDAIQKYCDGYGKYEEGNKVSYNQFQRYMDSTYGEGKFSFSEMIYPKMKAIALDSVKATYLQLDPNNTEHNFQVFGLDFMIDANYDVWLIEVNTNPCLQLSSKLLARLIPNMVEHSLRLTLDVIFPPPSHYPNSQKYLAPDDPLGRLQFQLIFDENRDGKQIQELFAGVRKVDMGEVDEEDETYENDGKEIQLSNEEIQ